MRVETTYATIPEHLYPKFSQQGNLVMKGALQDIVQVKIATTKFGPKPIWGAVIDGATYEVGFKKPKIDTGIEVEFETEFKYGKNQIIDGTLRVSGTPAMSSARTSATTVAPSPIAPPSGSAPYAARGSRVFPIPTDSGEVAIIRQNALTNAREVFVNGGVKFFGKTATELNSTSETAKAIIEMAREFEKYTTGQE